jgi:hypothetical protein
MDIPSRGPGIRVSMPDELIEAIEARAVRRIDDA